MVTELMIFVAVTLIWAYGLNYLLEYWHRKEGVHLLEEHANNDTKESDA